MLLHAAAERSEAAAAVVVGASTLEAIPVLALLLALATFAPLAG